MANGTHLWRHRAAVIYGWDCIFCDASLFCILCEPDRDVDPSLRLATLEHLTPRSKGGVTSLDNIALSCSPCNSSRSSQPLPPKHWTMTGHIPLAEDVRRKAIAESIAQATPDLSKRNKARSEALMIEVELRKQLRGLMRSNAKTLTAFDTTDKVKV